MKFIKPFVASGLFIAALLMPMLAQAAGGDISLLQLNDTETGQELSVKLQILVIMTLLGFLPAMLMMMTCFTRFIIVLAILRQALGLQQSPPNSVLVGVALCLSMMVMRPVATEIYTQAYVPFENDQITLEQSLGAAKKTISHFMLAQTNQNSLETMVQLSGDEMPANVADVDFFVLLPAFVLSELKTAFQLGFMIFLPFLVIDLIVASVLMAMGMMMLSPMMISLPFKLMIFVLVDGWTLLVGTLATSVQPF
ncbi:MAG: flagellar type III secretion system pore protein FliP [Cellvibrio sp.]|uniref:flagellar type III secretion system pore protein FliP n=1 Tax=Cellvibrio sp. TaxID=1965322 RepID=UPI0031A77902